MKTVVHGMLDAAKAAIICLLILYNTGVLSNSELQTESQAGYGTCTYGTPGIKSCPATATYTWLLMTFTCTITNTGATYGDCLTWCGSCTTGDRCTGFDSVATTTACSTNPGCL